MDLYDQEKAAEVWQRVQHREPRNYYAMAELEGKISRQCQGLYRKGFAKHTVSKLYRQSQSRKRALEAIARQAGEPRHHMEEMSRRADVGTLLELLGRAAWGYDPEHPVYGPMFRQMREECAEGQRLLLEATAPRGK